MALVRKWKKSRFAEIKNNAMADFKEKCIRALKYVGESCVSHAKENAEYTDRTANLKNSITYIILDDGKVIDGNYNDLRGDFTDVEGYIINELLDRLQNEVKSGITLVVIAGMEYGKWVESMGYNVLTKTELFAEKEINFFITKM